MATRRPAQELIAEIDGKIAYHNECIKKLQVRKDALSQPRKTRTRKTSMRKAIEAVKESGLAPDEVLAMLKKVKPAKG